MSAQYILLQIEDNPFQTRFEDPDHRLAFTVAQMQPEPPSPNLLVKVTREPPWSQQHSDIMGPSTSFLYFGPQNIAGYLVYGNGPTQPMTHSMRQKKEASTSRYFTAQNGKDYKWKGTPEHMECVEGRSNVLAIWEKSHSACAARLTIKHSALPIVTEILTTLTLNRMAHALRW